MAYGVKHRVEVFPCTVEAHVNSAQCDCSRAGEYEETKAVFLGPRVPGLGLLLVLEGINAEEQLGNREEEHDAEEDSASQLIMQYLSVRMR